MMSNAERLYALATRAYPPAYAAEHGDELVETACELTGHRMSIREAAGLVAGGMRTRARVATTAGRGASVWASGLRLGLLFFSISQLAWTLSPPQEWGSPDLPIWAYSITVAMVAGLTVGTGRWYASFATVTTLGAWTWTLSMGSPTPPLWLMVGPALVLLALVWWLALRTDGRRAVSPLGGIAMTLAWWGVFAAANGFIFDGLIGRSGNLIILAAAALLGVAVLSLDPRLLAGVAVFYIINVASNLPWLVDVLGVGIAPQLAVFGVLVGAAWFTVRRGSRQLHHA